jgi:hypothetical protein
MVFTPTMKMILNGSNEISLDEQYLMIMGGLGPNCSNSSVYHVRARMVQHLKSWGCELLPSHSSVVGCPRSASGYGLAIYSGD